MCPCHDPYSYVPAGLTPQQADQLRLDDRDEYLRRARRSMVTHLEAMIALHDEGIQVFEYGTSIRKECRDAGMPEQRAMQIPGFVAAYLRKLFLLGRGPFRWTCLSGEASDLARLDDLALEMFPHDETTVKWINWPANTFRSRRCPPGSATSASVNARLRCARERADPAR